MARHASLLVCLQVCVAAQLHLHFTLCTFLAQRPRRPKKKVFCFKMKDFLPTGDTESKAAEDAHVAQPERTKVAEKDLGLVPFP